MTDIKVSASAKIADDVTVEVTKEADSVADSVANGIEDTAQTSILDRNPSNWTQFAMEGDDLRIRATNTESDEGFVGTRKAFSKLLHGK
jgi:hypothetical protein